MPKRTLARRTHPDDIRGWSRHEGRHALDGYLEDVMALHAQGVDPAEDRSARLFVKDGKLMLVSTRRETLSEIRDAMQGGYDVIGKLAKRPDEDTLEELLRDSPFSAGLPPPRHAQRALPAYAEDSVTDDEDARSRARRSTRRGRRS